MPPPLHALALRARGGHFARSLSALAASGALLWPSSLLSARRASASLGWRAGGGLAVMLSARFYARRVIYVVATTVDGAICRLRRLLEGM